MKKEDLKALEDLNIMCIESLDPELFEAWERVKKWLIKTRKGMKDEDPEKPKSGMYREMPTVHFGMIKVSMMSDKEGEENVWIENERFGGGMEIKGSLLENEMQKIFDENM